MIKILSRQIHGQTLLLGLVETGIAFACFYLGAYLRFINQPGLVNESVGTLWPRALVFALLVLTGMISAGLYRSRQRSEMSEVVARIAVALSLAAFANIAVFYIVPIVYTGRGAMILAIVLCFPLLVGVRKIFYSTIDGNYFRRRVLVLGAGMNARPIARMRRKADQRSFQVLGFVPCKNEVVSPECESRLCRPGSLVDFIVNNQVDEIVVALDDQRNNFPIDDLLVARTTGVRVVEASTFIEQEAGRIDLQCLRPTWLIYSEGFRHNTLLLNIKRLFDIAASSLLLFIMLPIILLAGLAVFVDSGFRGPIFYRQARVGFRGNVFSVLKFRSMSTDAEADGQARWASGNDSRVTSVGRVLRRFRIDELPQILNILKGEMSFVGPRPERPEFVDQLAEQIPFYRQRHGVKPGLTGWAQLCYPYGSTVEDARHKLQYELYYVKNHNLLFDLMILLQTLEVVLWGRSSVMPGDPARVDNAARKGTPQQAEQTKPPQQSVQGVSSSGKAA